MKCSLDISDFLEDISSFFSFYCLSLFLCVVHLRSLSCLSLLFFGTLQSDGYIFCFLLCLSFLFSDIHKTSQDNHFALLHFFFLCMVLAITCCTVIWTSVHSSLGTLSDLIPLIYLSSPLYNHKRFYTFFNLILNFAVNSQLQSSSATVSSRSSYCWLYMAPLSLAARSINQSEFSIHHLVISMCRVISCIVGRMCLLWPVHSLGKTLLAFALLHFVFQSQTFLSFQISLDFLFLHYSSLWWKRNCVCVCKF